MKDYMVNGREEPQGKPKDVEQWGSKFIGCIINYGQALWRERNAIVHGRNYKEERIIRRKNAQKRVRSIFARRNALRASDRRRLCKGRLKDRLGKSTQAMEAWISHMETALKVADKIRRDDIKQHRQRTVSEWVKSQVDRDNAGER